MDCPNCRNVLEIYSVEYKRNGSIMEPRTWHYCKHCHQIWILNEAEPHKTSAGSLLHITRRSWSYSRFVRALLHPEVQIARYSFEHVHDRSRICCLGSALNERGITCLLYEHVTMPNGRRGNCLVFCLFFMREQAEGV